MPVFVLNFQEFEDKCFCVCEPSSLNFLGSWQVHMFAGTKRLRDDSLRRRDGLGCARYDRYEASETASWSSHSDKALIYTVIMDRESEDRVFVYEEHSNSGSYEMNLVINYLDRDKLYENDSRLEDEEYVLTQPDLTGSSLIYEAMSVFGIPYGKGKNQYERYDGSVSKERRTWEIQENKTIIETITRERTITRLRNSSETGLPYFHTIGPIISSSTNVVASPELRLLRDTYSASIDFGDIIEGTLSIDAMLGELYRVRQKDETSSEVVNTRFGRDVPSHTLTGHKKADSTWNSKVERLTPPLFQIVASVQDINTLKFFPNGEGRFRLDDFTLEFIPIEPGRTNNGIPLTFNYGAVDDFETVGWLFNEDADSSPTNTNFIKFYSPILARSEVTEYTCLTSKDRETNYVNDGVSHGGFHYPGRKFDPADVDG